MFLIVMNYTTLKIVEVGMDIQKEEAGKIYFNDGGVKYEIQLEEGVEIPNQQLRSIFIQAVPDLRRMTGPILEVRVDVELRNRHHDY
jgi:hypothetical protein